MNQPKEIVIKIKTTDIKKIIYFSVVLILVALTILQYLFPISCPECDTNCEEVVETKPKTDLTEIKVIPDPIAIEPQEEEEEPEIVEEEEEDEDEEKPQLAVTGNVFLKIEDIIHEVKGEDWAKVTKIKYTVGNADSDDFSPRIFIYCYDDNDPTDQKAYIEEEIYLSKLKSGYEITKTSDVSISFNEIDQEKTLKLVLKNEDDEILETVSEEFTVS